MKKLISFSLVVIMTVTLLFAGNQQIFAQTTMADLDGHWAKDYVQRLVNLGAINGYPDGTFRPNNTISRAAFIKVLCGVMDMKPIEKSYFEDTDGHWASGYIAAAVEAGLIRMEDFLFVSDDTTVGYYYHPDQNITREEIAVISTRALGDEFKAINSGKSNFADSSQIQEYNQGYVSVCVEQGIINGYPDNTFGPLKGATRAEASVVIGRIIDKIFSSEREVMTSGDIYQSIKPSMVKISTIFEGEEMAIGSGFNISPEGKIVTNHHVISSSEEFFVEFEDGTKKKVTSVHNYLRSKDIAVLNIEGNGYPVTPIGSSRSLRVGDAVYSMGYPLTMDLTIGNGIISSRQVGEYGDNFLLTTAPISPGSSGGVLLNSYGEAVGITQGTFVNGQNMNTCIPISDVIRVMTGTDFAYDFKDTDMFSEMDFFDMEASLVGIKENGERESIENGRFNIDDYNQLGLKYRVSNILRPQDDELPLLFSIEDSYGDPIQVELQTFHLDEGIDTEGELSFLQFNIDYIYEGSYRLAAYIGQDLVLRIPFVIETDATYSEKGISNISIDTFTYETYGEERNIVLKDKFHYLDYDNVGFVLDGFINTSKFVDRETEQALIDVVVERPDGSTEDISTMLYLSENGQFKITFGPDYYRIGLDELEKWIGSYKVKVYYKDQLLCKDTFEVHNDKTYTIQSLDKSAIYYYNWIEEVSKDIIKLYESTYDIQIPITMGQVTDTGVIDYKLVLKSSNAETEIYEGGVNRLKVTKADSFSNIELSGGLNLSNDMIQDYIDGETISVDIYIGGELFETVDLEFDIAEVDIVVEDAMVFTSASKVFYLTGYAEAYENYIGYDNTNITIDSEKEDYLYYMVKVSSDLEYKGNNVIDDMSVQFINNESGEVVYSHNYCQSLIHKEFTIWYFSENIAVDNLSPGEYTLRVLDNDNIVFEKNYTIQ